MDEDLNLDTELEEEEKLQTENKNRLKKLSEKVIQEKKEKEELAEAKAKLEEEKAKAEKERDFFKDFSSQSSKYPKASEHQDAIWEKVQKGYSTEDAIVSTLAKEGKLTMETQQESPKVEGGSTNTSQLLVSYMSDVIRVLEPELQYARLGVRKDVPKGFDRIVFPQPNQLPVKINVS